MSKLLSCIAAAIGSYSVHGSLDLEIAGLAYDSRSIRPGFLFFALPGLHTDGHEFIDKALDSGATAVVCEREPREYRKGATYLRVADARTVMSPAAAAFFDRPSDSLRVIGVTGTEGKSTTVYFLWQLLNMSGRKAGFFSTVMSDTGRGERPNPEHQTTPEATSVQGMLADMRDSGLEYAVVESSSHGLSPRTSRLADVAFDVGVMTNVTHEHLEFHGTWENYRNDKANLFRALDAHTHVKVISGTKLVVPSAGIVNADDPSASYFHAATAKPVLSYSSGSTSSTTISSASTVADLHAEDIVQTQEGITFAAVGPAPGPGKATVRVNAFLRVPGSFNVANALAACLAASATSGSSWTEFIPLLPRLRPVRGRMQKIDRGQPFDVIIDYAHTPSSFLAVLPGLRKSTKGKLFCVFGSGGERDREKRPQQGRIAADHCDVVILADEDPRGEDPMALLEEIAAGCPELVRGERLHLIPSRPSAIRKAFSLARSGDSVVLLGKGHENSIIYKNRATPYDEEAEAIAALAESGYRKGNIQC